MEQRHHRCGDLAAPMQAITLPIQSFAAPMSPTSVKRLSKSFSCKAVLGYQQLGAVPAARFWVSRAIAGSLCAVALWAAALPAGPPGDTLPFSGG